MSFNIVIKAGSQSGDTSFKDGMIVDVFPAGTAFSATMRRVYAIVTLPDSLRAVVNATLLPLFNEDGDVARARCLYLKLDELAAALGDATLVDRWRGVDVVPVVDGTGLTGLPLYSTSGVTWSDIDLNAHTSGSFTVGTGGDFANWTTASADIGATMTGHLTYTQISDTTEAGRTSSVVTALQGFTLTCTSNKAPKGVPGAGWISTMNGAASLLIFNISNTTGGGTVQISNLNVYNSAIGGLGTPILGITSTPGGNYTFLANDNLVIGLGATGSVVGISGSILASAGSISKIWNNTVDIQGGFSRGIQCASGNVLGVTNLVENNTVIHCFFGFLVGSSSYAYFRNNLSVLPASACYIGAGMSDTTAYNNAGSDASGGDGSWKTGSSGNVVVITVANELISTSASSSSFAKVKAGGSCDDGGVAPAISANTTGCRGNARPHSGTYSIGADEYSAVVYPDVTSVTPGFSATAGGAAAEIIGTGFAAGVDVEFGGVAATDVVVVSATKITCVVPAHASGQVHLDITNTDTGMTSVPFYYDPAPPTTTITISPDGLEVTVSASGSYPVFRASLFGPAGEVREDKSIVGAGDIVFTRAENELGSVVVWGASATGSPLSGPVSKPCGSSAPAVDPSPKLGGISCWPGDVEVNVIGIYGQEYKATLTGMELESTVTGSGSRVMHLTPAEPGDKVVRVVAMNGESETGTPATRAVRVPA